MKTTDSRHYYVDEGKVLVRKIDGFIMGRVLDLGENDSIDNYKEQKVEHIKNEKQ